MKKMELALTLKGLAPGTYRQKSYSVNAKYGNILEIWREMDYADEIEREDLKHIRRVCEPRMRMQTMDVEGSSAVLQITLEPNEICLIKFKRML